MTVHCTEGKHHFRSPNLILVILVILVLNFAYIHSKRRKLDMFTLAPFKGIQDSLQWFVQWIARRGFNSRYWISDYLSRNLDSRFQTSAGNRISWAEFQIPKPRILDSTSKDFPDSEIRITLHDTIVSPSHKMLQIFVKIVPKFFKSCPKLFEFDKNLLKSYSVADPGGGSGGSGPAYQTWRLFENEFFRSAGSYITY